jgi:hypothetical protein
VLEVPAGIGLTGAAGRYGTTRKTTVPAVPGAGIRSKEKETTEQR